MTDVPRRSYPLVVAPPGSFEDAVRRGRSMRRRKAGGTTGAALALVGAIAYSTMGGSAGTSGLQPTNDNLPRREVTAPGYVAPTTSPEPSATVSPSARPSTGNQTTVGGPGTVPSYAPPTGGPTPPPVRDTRAPAPTTPYAKRAASVRSSPMPSTQTDTNCLPASGNWWCAQAYAQSEATETGTQYRLTYTLCRSVDANGAGVVEFDRRQQANFSTKDVDRNDTLWTYSKGQPVAADSDEVRIDPGYCVEWSTLWDGQDDWGYTPTGGPGKYAVTGSSMGTSDTPLPSDTYEFQIT